VIEVRMTFSSVEEMLAKLGGTAPAAVAPAPTPAPVAEPAPAPAAPAEKPKKPKAAKVEVTVEPAPAPAPAEAAQDKKDEAPKATTPAKDVTIDDVRNTMGLYVKKYGMPAAQADGPALLAKMFGEGCKKISDIPNTPEMYGKAIAAIEEMIAKNPNNRTAV